MTRRRAALAVLFTALLAPLADSSARAGVPEQPTGEQAGDKTDQLARWAATATERPSDHVAVELVVDPATAAATTVVARAVRANGGRVTGGIDGFLIQASVPAAALAALDDAPGVATVRRPLPQDLRLAGDEPAELEPFVQALTGDEIGHTNAAAWHAAGHHGAGVRIGIVDGFDGASWNAAVANGDLPTIDPSRTFCVLTGTPCNIWTTGIKHGVAVAEIAHELAPAADLYLATALTAADLAAAVDWFAANGVTVVNRSLGAPLDGPGDGTGPLDAVVDDAVAAGMSWFNSAGNAAGRDGRSGDYYRAPFTDTDGDGWHEFVSPTGQLPAGGPYEDLAMDCEGSLLSSLRWSDWGDLANATDYDLFVFSTPSGSRYQPGYDIDAALSDPDLVTAAYDDQGAGGGAPPLEHLNGTCSGSTVYLAIRRFAANNGSGGDTLELMAEADLETWSNPYSALYPIVDSANPGVFGIGSVVGDHSIAYYSSEGPTNDGRRKPDFTARSGVHTVTLPTFNGTSASAPAAAGLAALALGAGRATSPAELREWLTTRAASDLGPCGPDNVFGHGELVLPDPAVAPTGDPAGELCAARFESLTPTRILDTRPGETAPGPKGIVPAESTVDVQATGGPVPADAVAVAVNLTIADAAGPGYVTAYPAGSSRPVASAVNVTGVGQTRAAFVTVPVGADGRVTLYTKRAAHLIVDVAGYYVDAGTQPASAGRFVALTPARLFDTRADQSAGTRGGPIGARQLADVDVLGRAGVPASGVAAVVVNLTGTEATAAGYLIAFPSGSAPPMASTVNLAGPGATAANLAIVPLGSAGRVSVYASHGAHALADVVGYITDGSAPAATTGLFVPLAPTRVFDTRTGAPVGAEATITRQVGGTAGVPLDASAVMLSVTGVDGPPGYLTVWDTGAPRPVASTLNLDAPAGDTRANGAMLRLGTGGQLDIYAKHGAHVLADVSGYFLG